MSDAFRPEEPTTSVAPSLAPGVQLGPYILEARLGEGGMGAVWKARDPRVSRYVAIKVLHDEFSGRFRREASAVAALNHPNICTLFDVGPNYLVMELCEGITLADRLRGPRLAVAEVLKFGAQIAAALAEAHAKGIVHRDLKPANIILVKSGVKVLDFGLAKSSHDETITAAHVIVGTPAYMAPEQKRGQDAGARTDIYALGLVLSEMATGTRGSTDGLAGAFAHLVRRCLAEDPDDRWQSAADIKAQLDWLQAPASAEAVSARATPAPRTATWVRAALVALVAFGAGALLTTEWQRSAPSPVPADVPAARLDLSLDFQSDGFRYVPQPSPDGRYLAYLGREASGQLVIRIRSLSEPEARTLAGTESARTFFWSADSKWVGFVVDDKIKKIAPTGGAVQTLVTVDGAIQEPTWGSRGDILYRRTNREALSHLREDGGTPEFVTTLDKTRTENSHRGQQFLPDGRRFIFTARCVDRTMNSLYLGSLDTKSSKRLMPIDSDAFFISQGPDAGLVMYERDGALVARRLNLAREEIEGDAFVVLDRIGWIPSGLIVNFSASRDGRVAVSKAVNAELATIETYSRTGERLGTLGDPGQWSQVRFSPDGTRIAATGLDPQTGNRDVFTLDLRGVAMRLTTNTANDWFPVWAPDSKRLLFVSDRPAGGSFVKMAASATSSEDRMSGSEPAPQDWSRDGRWLIGGGNEGPWVAEARLGSKTMPLKLAAGRGIDGLGFSPDGRWLAYVSDESGAWEVYVRAFHGPDVAADAIQVSRGGGDFPVWNPAGGELLFTARDSTIMSFSTKNLQSGAVPDSVRLFRPCQSSAFPFSPASAGTFLRAFDTHDGQRFIVTCTVEPPGRFSILLNWKFS